MHRKFIYVNEDCSAFVFKSIQARSESTFTHLQVLAVRGLRQFELEGLLTWSGEEMQLSALGAEPEWPLAECSAVRMTNWWQKCSHCWDCQLEKKNKNTLMPKRLLQT